MAHFSLVIISTTKKGIVSQGLSLSTLELLNSTDPDAMVKADQ